MPGDFLIKLRSSKDFQTLCYAILLILCIANLIVIFVIVSSSCSEIYLSGGNCAIGIGWFFLTAVFIVIGAVAARGLFMGLRAGHQKIF